MDAKFTGDMKHAEGIDVPWGDDKRKARIKAMITETQDDIGAMTHYLQSAVTHTQETTELNTPFGKIIGVRATDIGVHICGGCLQKAIDRVDMLMGRLKDWQKLYDDSK